MSKRNQASTLVYFPLVDEPYYLVVVVGAGKTGGLAVSGVYCEAAVRVYLAVSSRGLLADEITARVGLQPTQTRSIGEPISSRAPARTYKEHRWMFEPQAGCARERGWGGDPQFGAFDLASESVRRLAVFGAEVSVVLYAFGPRMLEDEAIS